MMRETGIKAIIFDVDGVLFKTYDENGDFLWIRSTKEDLGLSLDHLSIIFSEKWGDITKGKLGINSVFAIHDSIMFY